MLSNPNKVTVPLLNGIFSDMISCNMILLPFLSGAMPMTENFCACGCGMAPQSASRYARGHHMRTAEARARMTRERRLDRSSRDLTGQRFHKLVVIEWAGWSEAKKRDGTWNCQCDCGRRVVVLQRNLVCSKTKSCGCIIGKHKRTHGGTGTEEYRIWDGMRRRCSDPTGPSYPRYGGRGIKVCERWEKDFAAFLSDMGPRPSPLHTLDRYPDNDGNYEPGNCRWATMREQSNNRRSNRTLTFNGQTKTYAEWEREMGLRQGAVTTRLAMGWTPEEALTIKNGHDMRRPTLRPNPRRARVSPMELAVLDFIRSEIAAGRPAPRQRDIAKHFGYASKNSARQYLNRLQRHGFIRLVPRSEGRIQLVQDTQ